MLLRVDFGLDWWIPDGQLIPPLPNRANYIHWLEDLLALSSPNQTQHIVGLDIGCGTNLIYPLLGCAMHTDWRFVAVDTTPEALSWARRNADANATVLQDRITVRESGAAPALGKPGGACVCCIIVYVVVLCVVLAYQHTTGRAIDVAEKNREHSAGGDTP